MNNTIYGVIGHNGKLGRLLSKRPNFVPVECDITSKDSIYEGMYSAFGEEQTCNVLVNCAGISSVDECEANQDRAIEVNVRGSHLLHEVYGSRVLTISSDYVFPGTGLFRPKENSLLSPVNEYGWTKVGAEAVSNIQGGKIIRLSRSVSIEDDDIAKWLMAMYRGEEIYVPSFFHRNYLTRSQVVDGIEFFVRNYDSMPDIVHYGALDTVSMYTFMKRVAKEFKLDSNLVVENREYNPNMTSRPLRGGFKVGLANSLGFPMYFAEDAAKQLAKDANV